MSGLPGDTPGGAGGRPGTARGRPGHALRFALRALRREWRAGELRALFLALLVAVGSITAVGFFTARMERGMLAGASELLAADLLIDSSVPIASRYQQRARALGLKTAHTLSFRTALVSGQRFVLASIKAVGKGYPLRGRLRTAPASYAPDHVQDTIPAPGCAWLDPRLAGRLGRGVGDTVQVGAARLRVTHILSYEPDRGGDLFNIAPRLMMNIADVPATQLVQPASRVRYHLLMAGRAQALATFSAWAAQRLAPNQKIESVRDARPQLRSALDRARQYLGLAALVSVLLAGVAMAVAARRYAARRLDASAVMRCLGASQRLVLRVHVLQLLFFGLAGSVAGCLLGYAAQALIARALTPLLGGQLPAASFAPVPLGLGAGLVTMLGFALPPVMQLRRVPPARVLRHDLAPPPAGALLVYGLALGALGMLVSVEAGDGRLAAYAVGGSAVTLVMLAAAALGLVRALGALRGRVGIAWRFGFANVARRAGGSVIQVVAFGLGIAMLLLLGIVRGDLLDAWRASLPADAPNYFLINIQPAEVKGVHALLASRGLRAAALHPMVRGRLATINGRTITPDDYRDPRARHLAARDFNLSWSDHLQADNAVAAGRFWSRTTRGVHELSVERGLAHALHIKLGDELGFRLGGERFTARVTSLRKVDWDSFHVNFFVLAPPGVLERYPATWITAFHLPEHQRGVLLELVKRFPSVTVIDVDALISKVRQIMNQAAVGIEYVFGFTVLAGFTVLFAAIQSTLDERRYETAVLRTLGASRGRLRSGLLAEFLSIGLLAGLLAALAASVLGALIAQHVFGLTVLPRPWVWLAGIGGGGIGVALAGLLGTRPVLNQPPLRVLRGE